MKNIFSCPIECAQSVVGTKAKYRIMQLGTIFIGSAIFIFIFIMKKYGAQMDYVPFLFLIFLGAIAFPLGYLKAIRALIIEKNIEKNN